MKCLVAVVSAAVLLLAVACGHDSTVGDVVEVPTPTAIPTPSPTPTQEPAPTTAAPSPTGATGDEELFDVDFWGSLFGVGLAALLGLIGAFLVTSYFVRDR